MDETMSDMLAKLEQASKRAAAIPQDPDFKLTSDRVLEGSDDADHVRVVISDFEVKSISYDEYWFASSDRLEVARVTAKTVSTHLRRYFDEELEEALNAAPDAAELQQELKRLSADFNARTLSMINRLADGAR